MRRKNFWLAGLITLFALILTYQVAWAHESITVGDYEIEVGWTSEPPVAGQPNGIEIHVSNHSSGEPVQDVSGLTLEISYGGESKTLALEPLDEHSPGHFVAALVPTIPGQYTLNFGGTLGDTPVEAHAEIEEVQPADTLEFPASDPAQSETGGFGMTGWLALIGAVAGVAGLLLSLVNLRARK